MAALHGASFHRGWSDGEFERLLFDRNAVGHRATVGRSLVGFILSRIAGQEAEILSIAVASSRRGRGLAKQLLDLNLRRLAGLGVRAVFLEVGDDNEPALPALSARRLPRSRPAPGLLPRPGRQGVDRAGAAPRSGLSRSCERRHGPMDFGTPAVILRSPGDRVVNAPKLKDIEALCAAKGMRMTEQRRVIARVLAAADDHPDVEELYRRCSAIDEHISISTVYRTVKLFEDAGIIERHDFRDGRARYEQIPDTHHDHLINLRTGEVIEFQSEEIERLQGEIARRLGYRLVDHRLELYALPLDDKTKR